MARGDERRPHRALLDPGQDRAERVRVRVGAPFGTHDSIDEPCARGVGRHEAGTRAETVHLAVVHPLELLPVVAEREHGELDGGRACVDDEQDAPHSFGPRRA